MKYWSFPLVFLLFINNCFAVGDFGKCDIKIKFKEVGDVQLYADFIFDISLPKTEKDSIVALCLPFGKNPKLQVEEERTIGNKLVFFGFSQNMRKGLCLLTTSSKDETIKLIFKNVIIPIQESPRFENSNSITLDMSIADIISQSLTYYPKIKPYKIIIQEITPVFSNPEFKSRTNEENVFEIDVQNWNENIFIVVRSRDFSFFSIFWIVFFITLIAGGATAPAYVKKKANTIWALVLSTIGLIIFFILFYFFVIPTQYFKDFTVLSVFGSFAGLTLSNFIYSIFNLFVLIGIDKRTSKKNPNATD
jgi:hypothetical protein